MNTQTDVACALENRLKRLQQRQSYILQALKDTYVNIIRTKWEQSQLLSERTRWTRHFVALLCEDEAFDSVKMRTACVDLLMKHWSRHSLLRTPNGNDCLHFTWDGQCCALLQRVDSTLRLPASTKVMHVTALVRVAQALLRTPGEEKRLQVLASLAEGPNGYLLPGLLVAMMGEHSLSKCRSKSICT